MPKLLLLALALTGCVSSGRLPDADLAWRAGSHGRALALARAEYERFRDGNDLAEATVLADLAELVEVLRSTPIVLPQDPPAPTSPVAELPEDGLARGAMSAPMRRDLQSRGAVRVVRALRAVMRLKIELHARELLALVWRREPFDADHTAVTALDPARRSLLVKRAALDALEALARGPKGR